jgi:hypothetical protein
MAADRPQGPADNVMFDIVGQRRQHAFDIICRFEAKMLVQLRVHLRRRQRHHHFSRRNVVGEVSNETIISCQDFGLGLANAGGEEPRISQKRGGDE